MLDYFGTELNRTLYAPTKQNGQTHSNNSSANCLSVFDHLVGLALKGLSISILTSQKYYDKAVTKQAGKQTKFQFLLNFSKLKYTKNCD